VGNITTGSVGAAVNSGVASPAVLRIPHAHVSSITDANSIADKDFAILLISLRPPRSIVASGRLEVNCRGFKLNFGKKRRPASRPSIITD
jgi:hypothetical protein